MSSPTPFSIRPARLADLDALLALETACFDSDRLSRRSLRHALTGAHATCLVAELDGKLGGYVLVFFHKGTSLARLYSLAVMPVYRGQQLGEHLLTAAQSAAREHGCISLRLEIRRDNNPALQLYQRMGYQQIGSYADYYADHMDAIRMEKMLVTAHKPVNTQIPYYEQTLDFTCGPAALLMAMQALNPELEIDRKLELRLWREATTIFMASGHGGCGPYGLALAAYHRGFGVGIYLKDKSVLFVDSVRSAEKKEVIRLVQNDFLNEIADSDIALTYTPISVADLQRHFDAGGIPVVLVSSYLLYHERFPHWLVITGFDDNFVYVHDPYVDYNRGKSKLDCINIPILKKDFAQMARYGKTGQRAVLVLNRQK